jgi:hypothetical protein
MKRWIGAVAVLVVLVWVGQARASTHIIVDFNSPVSGTILDTNGLGSGFTDRLPGTGGSLPVPDTNLNLSAHPGYLTITSTPGSLGGRTSGMWPETEALGLYIPNIGSNDVTISARLTNVHLPIDSDHLGIYAGAGTSINSDGEWVRAALHLGWYGSGHQYLLNTSGSDPNWASSGSLFSEGDTIDFTVSRANGLWSMSWNDLTNGNQGSSPSFSGVNDFPDLYVGITYGNPGNNTPQTSQIDWFAVDYTGTVPEPTTIIIWSLLGALAVTLGWWRRRKAA